MMLPPQFEQHRDVCLHKAERCDDIDGAHPVQLADTEWLVAVRQVDYDNGAGLPYVDVWWAVLTRRQEDADLKAANVEDRRHQDNNLSVGLLPPAYGRSEVSHHRMDAAMDVQSPTAA
jgi:hypothetical protein